MLKIVWQKNINYCATPRAFFTAHVNFRNFYRFFSFQVYIWNYFSAQMEEEAKNIMQQAKELFLSRGFRNVTMDEIAQEMKISKKTIYKHFADKKALVTEVVNTHLCFTQNRVRCALDQELNAIEQMMELNKCLAEIKSMVPQNILFEVEKYFPEAYKLIDNHKENFVKKIIIENIGRGQKEGLYRTELNPEFIANMYLVCTNHIITSKHYAQPDYVSKVLPQFFLYHLHGIATERGLAIINESKSNL